jgi:hypothetical protein
MTNASQPADSLARRLVAEIAVHARLQPNRWVMLGDIVPKLGVSWEEADAAAQFAAAKPREWIEHNTHSLMLRQAGRDMLEEAAQSTTIPVQPRVLVPPRHPRRSKARAPRRTDKRTEAPSR